MVVHSSIKNTQRKYFIAIMLLAGRKVVGNKYEENCRNNMHFFRHCHVIFCLLPANKHCLNTKRFTFRNLSYDHIKCRLKKFTCVFWIMTSRDFNYYCNIYHQTFYYYPSVQDLLERGTGLVPIFSTGWYTRDVNSIEQSAS